MKISFKQFLSPNHSWSTMLNFAREMKRTGHEVHLDSTNGYKNFPVDMEENIKCRRCADEKRRVLNECELDRDYDLSVSYTASIHWNEYTCFGRNKFVVYNLDGSVLPKGWGKFHKNVDYILPSSTYSKTTFIDAGIPEEKIIVMPHCYDSEFIERKNIYDLKTDKRRKYLTIIQQPHRRKGLNKLLEAWGRAFTDKDDVVLVMKVVMKRPKAPFEVSFMEEFSKFKKKFKNHAQIILIDEFIDYISDLHRACDILFSMSNIECYLIPAMNHIVSGKLAIASGGDTGCGNTDFMNDGNSLLIKGKTVRLPQNFQYWAPSRYACMFEPDIDHAAALLQTSNYKHDELLESFKSGIQKTIEDYSAEKLTKNILSLCK